MSSSESLRPFHLAFPVDDLDAARVFYGQVLGCSQGRSDTHWIDFNFFGHQIVAHLSPDRLADAAVSDVDEESVPIPHFGVVLNMPEWNTLAERLRAAGTQFIIEPTIRFRDRPGEQATMFFRDPAGNALEIKAFGDDAQVFATEV